ncbi:MAG: BON domain-containing protein [Caldilineaceae bacterium]
MSWFGKSYKDEALVMQAEQALAEDVILNNVSGLGITSENGIVSLGGLVNSERERSHAEQIVRNALRRASLAHEEVVNEIAVK